MSHTTDGLLGGKKPGGRLPLLRGEEAENRREGRINAGFPGGESRVFQGDLGLEHFCGLIFKFRDFVLRVRVFCLSFFFLLLIQVWDLESIQGQGVLSLAPLPYATILVYHSLIKKMPPHFPTGNLMEALSQLRSSLFRCLPLCRVDK